MLRLRFGHRDKRFQVWSIIPICLFLISLGLKLPELSSLHCPPKPRPRAVIESVEKSCKPSVVKHAVTVAELFCALPELLPPEVFPSRFLPVTYRFISAAAPRISARAPPAPLS